MAIAQTDPTAQLEIAGLHSTEPEPLPFGGGSLSIRAFLLERAAGDLLIYSTTAIAKDGPPLRDHGPLARHYLNHHHEAMFLPEEIAAIDAPLVVGEGDRAAVEDRTSMPVHAFSKQHHADPDFEVIPTPGHTPGATAYLWTPAPIGCCSRATRSTSATESGWQPSFRRAIGVPTCGASS